MGPLRSLLFAPGNHARRVAKALGLGADAVVLDLEDAVAVTEKEAARAAVGEALSAPRASACYARVNAHDTRWCYADLVAVVGPGLDGVMLPKVESAAQLQCVDWLLAQLERERGMAGGSVDLLPIVETARGMVQVEAIAAASPRVRRLAFGAADYSLDVGLRWTEGEAELDGPRARVALASRAAGIEPPVDTVWARIGDLEGLERSARRARDLGFQGKLCIHPEQLGPVHAVFSPSADEIALAERQVRAFEAAEAAGSASIQVDGQFIDYPIVERARRVLALAARAGA